jgi:prepilin peptidase CpaA
MLEILWGVALAGLLAVAAWHDVRWRTIPNWIPAALVLLWVARWLAEGRLGPAASALGVAGLVLLVGYLAWLGGFLGGGDVKLLGATALWAGTSGLLTFLLATSLVGGALALAVGLRRRLAARRWSGSRHVGKQAPHASAAMPAGAAAVFTTVPYAAAILAGGVWSWLASHPF